MGRDSMNDDKVAAIEKAADQIENLQVQPDDDTLCTKLFGEPIFCGHCGDELLVLDDIQVVRGQVPQQQFEKALYDILCKTCAGIIEEAIKEAAGNEKPEGEVVEYNTAHKGAVIFVKNGINNGFNKRGCVFCYRKDPGKEASEDQRHQVIKGSAEVWAKEPELEALDGCEVCSHHLKTMRLAVPGIDHISVDEAEEIKKQEREAKRKDEEAQRKIKIQELANQFKDRASATKPEPKLKVVK